MPMVSAISREGSLMVIVASEARALAIYDINGRLAASLSLEVYRNTVGASRRHLRRCRCEGYDVTHHIWEIILT